MVRNVWAMQGKVQVLSRRQKRMTRGLKGVFLSVLMDWRWHLLNGMVCPLGWGGADLFNSMQPAREPGSQGARLQLSLQPF